MPVARCAGTYAETLATTTMNATAPISTRGSSDNRQKSAATMSLAPDGRLRRLRIAGRVTENRRRSGNHAPKLDPHWTHVRRRTKTT